MASHDTCDAPAFPAMDVICLNVGGEKYWTERGTLLWLGFKACYMAFLAPQEASRLGAGEDGLGRAAC